LNWGVSLATPLVRMASPRPPRCRQGVGGTPHERKADACAGKNTPPPCARRGKGRKSPAYTPARGPPHRCNAGKERERRKERRGGRGREQGGDLESDGARLLRPSADSAAPRVHGLCSAHLPAGPRATDSAPPIRRQDHGLRPLLHPSAHLRLKPEPTCAQPVVLSAD